jgi:hypothetical protein
MSWRGGAAGMLDEEDVRQGIMRGSTGTLRAMNIVHSLLPNKSMMIDD